MRKKDNRVEHSFLSFNSCPAPVIHPPRDFPVRPPIDYPRLRSDQSSIQIPARAFGRLDGARSLPLRTNACRDAPIGDVSCVSIVARRTLLASSVPAQLRHARRMLCPSHPQPARHYPRLCSHRSSISDTAQHERLQTAIRHTLKATASPTMRRRFGGGIIVYATCVVRGVWEEFAGVVTRDVSAYVVRCARTHRAMAQA